MKSRRPPVWLYLSIALTAALSLVSMYQRFHVEERNRAVGLSAEFEVVQSLAAAQGLTIQEGLQRLKAKGLNSLVLSEETVSELLTEGQLQVTGGKFVTGTADNIRRLVRGVKMRFPAQMGGMNFAGAGSDMAAVQFPDPTLLRTVSLGLDPSQAYAAKGAGMMIVARCSNPVGATSDTVRQTVVWAKELGAEVILPEGDQVLGRRDSLDAFTEALRSNGIYYASPEFAKIGGDENVVEKAPELVIRLHSAQSQELDKMRVEEAVDRYSRAARERNQRLLLLRPVSSAADKPLDDFGDFVREVKSATEHQGGTIGKPHPFEEPGVPNFLFALIVLSIVPAALWTAGAFVRSKNWLIGLGVLLFGLGGACYLKPAAHSLAALVAALTFPMLAYLIMDGREIKSWLWEYALVSAISLVGGFAVAGLLNGLPYYIHAQQFLGVKFAHFAPIIAIGAYFFLRFGLQGGLTSPLDWAKALIALIVLVGLGFMLARTGNDNPAAVSGAELKIRDLLDVILFVRPRTKEFLIGHPFLILGIGLLIEYRAGNPRFQKWPGWITLFLMLGAIGSTSLVNTMCHIHTPLVIGLARIGVGLIAGGILGTVLLGVVKRFRPAEG